VTDEAWVRGFGDLVLAFPNREQSSQEAQSRAVVYRRHLDDLTDPQWKHAVAVVIRSERWFPTVAALRDYAETWTPPVAGYLGSAPRTEEQDTLDREAARKGLERIKAAVTERLRDLPPMPALGELPAAPRVVVAHDDRLEELRRQRDALLSEQE